MPLKPIIKFLKIFELFSINLPITSEMINRLQEDKTFEIEKAKFYLNFKPITLSKGIKMQIKSMKRDNYLI